MLTACSGSWPTYDDVSMWHNGCMSGAIESGESDPIGGWMICDKLCTENFSYTGHCEHMRLPKKLEE